LALSPQIFSSDFIDNSLKHVFSRKKIPLIPLSGVDTSLFDEAKEIGLERNINKLEKIASMNSDEIPSFAKKEVENALKQKKSSPFRQDQIMYMIF